MHKTFEIKGQNEWNLPVIMSAPHSGRLFPPDFLADSPLTEDALLATADLHTEKLIEHYGGVSIAANYARSFVDLNRARTQLDPALIEDLPDSRDIQVQNGYGVLPRFAKRGQASQIGKITMEMAQARLAQYYDPYHEALSGLIDQGLKRFGNVFLLDIHSAPAFIMNKTDIVFGSCHGRSCHMAKLAKAEHIFEPAFITSRDQPFAGGYITQHYSQFRGVEALQIEVNRDLLSDEKRSDFLSLWNEKITELLKYL